MRSGTGEARGTARPCTTFSLAVCVLLLTLASPGHGDTPSIEVAGVTLQLAMTRAEVLRKLGDSYRLIALGSEGLAWSVEEKTSKAIVGHLDFDDGRLVQVRRTWASFSKGDDAFDLGQAIVALLSDLHDRGGKIQAITTSAMAGAKLNMKVVELQFDIRTVKVIEVSGERESIHVDEILAVRD